MPWCASNHHRSDGNGRGLLQGWAGVLTETRLASSAQPVGHKALRRFQKSPRWLGDIYVRVWQPCYILGMPFSPFISFPMCFSSEKHLEQKGILSKDTPQRKSTVVREEENVGRIISGSSLGVHDKVPRLPTQKGSDTGAGDHQSTCRTVSWLTLPLQDPWCLAQTLAHSKHTKTSEFLRGKSLSQRFTIAPFLCPKICHDKFIPLDLNKSLVLRKDKPAALQTYPLSQNQVECLTRRLKEEERRIQGARKAEA